MKVKIFLCIFAKLLKVLLALSCLSVCMEQLSSTGRIFLKCGIWIFFGHLCRKFRFQYNLTRILHKDQYMYILHVDRYMYIYDNISLTSSQSEKCLIQNYRENQNTCFMLNEVLPEMVAFRRQSGKIWQSQTVQRWQYVCVCVCVCVCNVKESRCE